MKELIMTIGLPYSGKSTMVNQYADKGWQVIERDELLQEIISSQEFIDKIKQLTQNISEPEKVFQIKNQLAIDMLSDAVKKIVSESKNEKFIYDGTNLQRQARQEILELTQEKVDVKAIFCKTPIEEIIKRAQSDKINQKRQGAFNEKAKQSLFLMMQMFEAPSKDEGFTDIQIIEPENIEQLREIKNK